MVLRRILQIGSSLFSKALLTSTGLKIHRGSTYSTQPKKVYYKQLEVCHMINLLATFLKDILLACQAA
jgi:hypothetical protein